jgi:hypothetical protein
MINLMETDNDFKQAEDKTLNPKQINYCYEMI